MKLLSIMIIGLALALPVGAQTSPTEETKEPAKTETSAKTKAGAKPDVKSTTGAQTETSTEASGKKAGTEVQSKTGAQTETSEKSGSDTRTSTRVEGKSGAVSQSTTVFRNGRVTSERLSLHRTTRDRTTVHFSIGTHPRDWWLRTYSIVFIDSCYYYLAADGCWYPAYGFDPSCNYPEGIVYCE